MSGSLLCRAVCLAALAAGCSNGSKSETPKLSVPPADAAPLTTAPCPEPEPPLQTMGTSQRRLAATFADLPGWKSDNQAEAVPSFLASCAILATQLDSAPVGFDSASGTTGQWRAACAAAARVPAGNTAAAREFFEREFRPWSLETTNGSSGKMTAYCVHPLRASRTRHGPYQFPLYKRPLDLVEVQLTDFIEDGRGRRIWGQVDLKTGTMHRYPTRRELRASGALKGHEVAWIDDPMDAYLAQIEGTARATLDDGSVVWLDFDGKNSRTRKSPRSILQSAGILGKRATMDQTRAWFNAHTSRVDELLDANSSMVFFAMSTKPGARGSQGAILTPGRSLAVDRALVAHSTPMWIDTQSPGTKSGSRPAGPWQHLAIAQDTGGAILGGIRVDIYLGAEPDDVDLCNRINTDGRVWLLLPRAVDGVSPS